MIQRPGHPLRHMVGRIERAPVRSVGTYQSKNFVSAEPVAFSGAPMIANLASWHPDPNEAVNRRDLSTGENGGFGVQMPWQVTYSVR